MSNQKGATLIELIIYISIVGMILTTISVFLLDVLSYRIKTVAISEIAINGRLIQDRLHDAIRHAQAVNTSGSTFGSDPGVLSLDMVDSADDPTVFSLTGNDGQFQMSQGVSANMLLTSDSVEVTNLVFTNLTSADDVGIIQVQYTLKTTNPSSSKEYDYEESFQTTLRIPLDQ